MLISFVIHVQIFVHRASSSVNNLYKETGLVVIIPWVIFIIINFVSFKHRVTTLVGMNMAWKNERDLIFDHLIIVSAEVDIEG